MTWPLSSVVYDVRLPFMGLAGRCRTTAVDQLSDNYHNFPRGAVDRRLGTLEWY